MNINLKIPKVNITDPREILDDVGRSLIEDSKRQLETHKLMETGLEEMQRENEVDRKMSHNIYFMTQVIMIATLILLAISIYSIFSQS